MKTENHGLGATYKTDCFRKVKDEDGNTVVKRWVEERKVSVDIQRTDEGRVFWRGAAL